MSEAISRLGKDVRAAGRRWWRTSRTSCRSRKRRANGTPCSGGNTFIGRTSSCTGGTASGASSCAATTWNRACWRACSAAATGAWVKPSSWPGAAAPVGRLVRAPAPRTLVAGAGRRRHRRGRNPPPALSGRRAAALGPYPNPPRPRVPASRASAGGGVGERGRRGRGGEGERGEERPVKSWGQTPANCHRPGGKRKRQ